MSAEVDDLWQFSISLYSRPGVASACRVLQDEHDHDINLLLYCCWIGIRGRGAMTTAELTAADDAIAAWRTGVVQPLRAARRAIKPATDAGGAELYCAAKRVELEAEKICQQRLAAVALPPKTLTSEQRADDAIRNLTLYFGEGGLGAAAPIIETLRAAATAT